jgi:CubicO group peptidase (beta-lactamase class C family)
MPKISAFLLFGLGFVGFCILAANGQAQVITADADIEQRVDDYLRSEMQMDKIPGLSLTVMRDEKVLLTRNIGFADVGGKKPVTPDTAFEIGSLTKQFTAAAIMLLAEDHKLKLDDPIKAYIQDAPESWNKITIRNLLTHTSGIIDHTGIPQLKAKRMKQFLDPKEVLRVLATKPLEFQPGDKHAYTNTNYFLLGLIVTQASGQPYSHFMAERIFGPIGMSSTRLTDGKAAPDLAQGYKSTGKKVDYINSTSEGGIISTSKDLVKWLIAFDAGQVIKKESLAQVLTPLTLNDGRRVGYGFGWILNEDKPSGNAVIEHGGFTYGFSNFITRLPSEQQLTVIVLTNSDRGYTRFYTRGIAAIYAPWLKDYWARDELGFRDEQKKH